MFGLITAQYAGRGPVPGETALIVAAAYAGHAHRLSMWVIFVLALVAAVLGGYLGTTPARSGDSSCELAASARSPRSPRNWCDRRAVIWPEQGSGMRKLPGKIEPGRQGSFMLGQDRGGRIAGIGAMTFADHLRAGGVVVAGNPPPPQAPKGSARRRLDVVGAQGPRWWIAAAGAYGGL